MYDPQAREQAKTLYQQHGAAYVADKLGIPERTVRRWALAEGWQHRMTVVAGQETADGSGGRSAAAAILGWATRRRRAADEFGETAMRALAKLQAELAKARPRGIQPLAMAAVMLAKQAEEQLAVGSHGRGELSPEASVVRITELLDAIEPRAAGDGG
jgi:Putative ATPase subunit of terminase (gpP-like)